MEPEPDPEPIIPVENAKEKPVFKWHMVLIYILIAAVASYGVFLLRESITQKRTESSESETSSTTQEITTTEPFKQVTTTSPEYWFTYVEPTDESTTLDSSITEIIND